MICSNFSRFRKCEEANFWKVLRVFYLWSEKASINYLFKNTNGKSLLRFINRLIWTHWFGTHLSSTHCFVFFHDCLVALPFLKTKKTFNNIIFQFSRIGALLRLVFVKWISLDEKWKKYRYLLFWKSSDKNRASEDYFVLK